MCGVTRFLTVPGLVGSVVLVATGRIGFAFAAALIAAAAVGGWAYIGRGRGALRCETRPARKPGGPGCP